LIQHCIRLFVFICQRQTYVRSDKPLDVCTIDIRINPKGIFLAEAYSKTQVLGNVPGAFNAVSIWVIAIVTVNVQDAIKAFQLDVAL